MYSTPATTSGTVSAASGVPCKNIPSKIASGMKQARLMSATVPIGRSCSVRGRPPPFARAAARAREAASADVTPVYTGLASFKMVQIAEIPMVPAPMKRTWCAHTVVATSTAAPAAGCIAVSIGVSTPHAMSRPVKIARPTARPIKWPAPSRASDMPTPKPVAPAPTRK